MLMMLVISNAISALNWLKIQSSHFVVIYSAGHVYTGGCTITLIVKNAQFARPSYKRKNLFPFMAGAKTRLIRYSGTEIPNRPAGHRPATAPPPPLETNQFVNYGFGLMGGFVPMATARIGNFTMGFGGLLPSLFNIQFHGYPGPAMYGTPSGFPYGFHTFHSGHAHGFPPPTTRWQQADNVLKNLLLLIGFFVMLALLYW
ncbi:Nucleotide-diphospho-sugar transferases superfamily protein [Hibiscus syriacus]|uniref:Nucleotide-diphospho-sugar transferases superfamily protein n=1 Tax=Hibiscus syriacus TaxID=106335 RepID=A0A6A2Y5S0_HIBSY|nr:Nucleotide-diphospho-sugar transferases superfamily protein [Hibiscus syriacus]